MDADGWSLDDKRQPLLPEDKLGPVPAQPLSAEEHAKNNLPDVLARWQQRDGGERERPRTTQSFCVPKADIAANGYDLSINRYKAVVYEEAQHIPPKQLLAELVELEREIEDGRVFYDRDPLYIDEQTHRALGRSQVKPGDILVSIAGTIGRTAVVPENAPALNCNQAVAIVRTNGQVSRYFLRHWLESPDAQAQMRGATVTGTISNLSLTQIGNLKIPLPPLTEQRRIAAISDQAEVLLAKRRHVLTQLDAITRSLFLDLFGDPATNAKSWSIAFLRDLLAIPLRNGLSPSHSGGVKAKVLTLSAITGDAFRADAWKEAPFQSVPPLDQ